MMEVVMPLDCRQLQTVDTTMQPEHISNYNEFPSSTVSVDTVTDVKEVASEEISPTAKGECPSIDTGTDLLEDKASEEGDSDDIICNGSESSTAMIDADTGLKDIASSKITSSHNGESESSMAMAITDVMENNSEIVSSLDCPNNDTGTNVMEACAMVQSAEKEDDAVISSIDVSLIESSESPLGDGVEITNDKTESDLNLNESEGQENDIDVYSHEEGVVDPEAACDTCMENKPCYNNVDQENTTPLKISVTAATPGPSGTHLDTPYPFHKISGRRGIHCSSYAYDADNSFAVRSAPTSPAVMTFPRLRKFDGQDDLNLASDNSRKRHRTPDLESPLAKRSRGSWFAWVNPLRWLVNEANTEAAEIVDEDKAQKNEEATEKTGNQRSCILM